MQCFKINDVIYSSCEMTCNIVLQVSCMWVVAILYNHIYLIKSANDICTMSVYHDARRLRTKPQSCTGYHGVHAYSTIVGN